MKIKLILAAACIAALASATGCGRAVDSGATNQPAAPKKTPAAPQKIINDITGKTAVDWKQDAEKKLRAINRQKKDDLDSVQDP